MRGAKQVCRWVAAVLCAALLTVPAAGQSQVCRSVKTDTMRIALTFDDGPHPVQTQKILATLEKYHVPATFFMVGVNVTNYPDIARAVIAAGHEVGNHTFSHLHLNRMNGTTLSAEIGKCEDTLEELCEYRPHLFRPPEGICTPYVSYSAEWGDYTVILWSIDTRDWEGRSAREIAETVLNKIRPGDIVLMHDYIGKNGNTPQALEILLPELLARGYEPVTVSRLLGVG